MSIKLDWEVTDAPDDTGKRKHARPAEWAPVSPPASPQPETADSEPADTPTPAASIRPKRTAPLRRLWPLVTLAALLGLALSATWYITQQGWQRIQGDVVALVRYEEETAYAGGVNLVMLVQDQDNRDWLAVRRDQLQAALPAPTPLPMLALTTHAYAVDAVTAVDADFVTALVRREFAAPDGRSLPFVLPQFYRRRGQDDWQRTAPPGQYWGRWVDLRSEHLQIRYSERDAEFVTAVAPQLEAWLTAACRLWQNHCAGVLPAKLYLSGYIGSLEYDPLSNVEVRVEFGEGSGALAADYFLSVPSPQIAGRPTDAAGQAYLAEYLAVRLIASLADRATDNAGEYAALTTQAITALSLEGADPGYASALPRTQVGAGPEPLDPPAPTATPISPPTAARPGPTRTPAGPRVVNYTVREGDTLSGIASTYGVTVESVVSANAIADPDVLTVGTTLAIPLT